jgi:hypothetical protein
MIFIREFPPGENPTPASLRLSTIFFDGNKHPLWSQLSGGDFVDALARDPEVCGCLPVRAGAFQESENFAVVGPIAGGFFHGRYRSTKKLTNATEKL